MTALRNSAKKTPATGERGRTVNTDALGPPGPTRPPMGRADMLAVVEDQFADVHKRLDVQLIRTAEMQVQLDSQRAEMAALWQQVDLIHVR